MGQGHWPLAFEAAGGWGKGLMRGQFFKLRTNSVAYGRRLELEHVSVTSCVATCTAVQCSARVLNLVLGRLSGLALLCLGLCVSGGGGGVSCCRPAIRTFSAVLGAAGQWRRRRRELLQTGCPGLLSLCLGLRVSGGGGGVSCRRPAVRTFSAVLGTAGQWRRRWRELPQAGCPGLLCCAWGCESVAAAAA